MQLSLPIATRPLTGGVSVPGDKSLAHRAALFAALAEGTSEIARFPDSGVTRAMRNALAALGVPSTLENAVLRVEGHGFHPFPVSGATAFCGNSATTIRLLAGAVVGTHSSATLDGSAGLRKRPMNRIADPLRAMGASVTTSGVCPPSAGVCPQSQGVCPQSVGVCPPASTGVCPPESGYAPLVFAPSALRSINYRLPVASAQVLSCLQIAALGADAPSHFTAPGPVRDHTVRMLRAMGARIDAQGFETTVYPLGDSPLSPLHATLPGDISSAAFLLAAAALVPGSVITVTHVGVNPTRTGILDILQAMGAQITRANEHDEMGEPVADITLTAAPLKAVEIAGDLVVRAIDEFPAIAAVAAFAAGTTVVHGATELRYKETDRIAAIVTQLRALGATVEEFPDGFAIQGGTLTGGTAHANGDHRLAMSMALCGLRAPVVVEGAEILTESFPTFEPTLRSLLQV